MYGRGYYTVHLSTKKLSFLGLLLAICIVLIILSGILEFNTLFLLAAASFCVGIAFREGNIMIAFGFYLAAIVLGFLLAPNKLYCITFAGMGMYLLVLEFAYDRLAAIKRPRYRSYVSFVIKYLVFNAMYLPALFIMPTLFYAGEISQKIIILLIVGGQIAIFIYDRAYHYFQRVIWQKFRNYLEL